MFQGLTAAIDLAGGKHQAKNSSFGRLSTATRVECLELNSLEPCTIPSQSRLASFSLIAGIATPARDCPSWTMEIHLRKTRSYCHRNAGPCESALQLQPFAAAAILERI